MTVRQSIVGKILGFGVMLLLSTPAGVAAAQPCVQPPPGVVGWWPGDGDAADIAGGAHGTLQGGATFATGLVGQAFSFNGEDAAVESSPTNIMNVLPLTIETWVQPALRTDETAFIPSNAVSNDNPNLGGHGFGVNVFATDSRMVIEVHEGWREVPGVSFIAGQWYHVAVVYTTGNFKAYVNGELVDDFSFSQGVLDGANLVRIGKHNDDDFAYGTERFFKGLIDEVTLYLRALSAEEIQAIFNAGSSGKCKETVGGVGGTVTGLRPALIVCKNLTTGHRVVIQDQETSWNCETAGLEVTPGDIVLITILGGATNEGL